MRKLVEHDQRNLRALVVKDGVIVFKVIEFNIDAVGENPIEHVSAWHRTKQRVEFKALVPKAALVFDLLTIPPKNNRVEVFVVVVPQRFEEDTVGLPAYLTPSRATENAYVGGRAQKRRLWSGLWRYNYSLIFGWIHLSSFLFKPHLG